MLSCGTQSQWVHSTKHSCTKGSGKIAEVWTEINQGVCCEIVASSIFRSYTHKVSPHELNKDTNEHAKVNGRKPMRPQAYIKNYGQLK